MKKNVVLLSILACDLFLATSALAQDPKPLTEAVAVVNQALEANTPPPELAMLTAIDENLRGRYTVAYWETQVKDGSVVWISKAVEKEANLEFAVFQAIGGKKGVKGVKAIESLRMRLPVPILITKDGKELDPFYETFYRPGVVVISYPSKP
jgi:hypothetical protein